MWSHLLLNVNKTKEIVVDFRRKRTATESINIISEKVGIVDHYKDATRVPTLMVCTRKK